MTEQDKMPDVIYVFNDPKSIGDMGFTVTHKKESHDKYVRAVVTKEDAMQMLEKLNSFAAINGISHESGKRIAWDFVGYNESKLRALLEAASK